MKRLFLLYCLASISCLSNAQAQAPDKSYFQHIYAATRKALQREQQGKAQQLSAFLKRAMPDSADYDAIYYDLNLVITTSPHNLEGTVTGVFRSNVDSLTRVNLNFDSRDYLPPWQGFSVSGNVTSWTHANWVLSVQLNRPYGMGEVFSITVHYSGLPRGGGLKGFGFDVNQYGDLVISTLSEPYQAQYWWPCKDDPADKADSVRISVTVPENLIAASNGLLTSEVDNGNGTKIYVWKENYPITTYLVSLAISNYATFSDRFEYLPGQYMPIDYYVYPAQLPAARSAFAPIPEMLRIYSALFGMYPFTSEKYGQAVFEWGGAMEHQTLTSVGGVSSNWKYGYAHELAHQWFGDLVTCQNWGDIWLNEGFATYSEALYVEQLFGSRAYHDYVEFSLEEIDTWGDDPIFRYMIDDPLYIFEWTVYEKGAWVLHMLRHVIGDSAFFQILHDYPNDPAFKFKTATTAQFREFCERVSGSELGWFFQPWIYEPNFPVYNWGYAYKPSQQGHTLFLGIEQTQDQISAQYDHLYKMPIDVRVDYVDGTSKTMVIWDSLKVQTYTLQLDTIPQDVSLDPEIWILKKTNKVAVEPKLAITADSLRFVSELYQPDTLRFIIANQGLDSLRIERFQLSTGYFQALDTLRFPLVLGKDQNRELRFVFTPQDYDPKTDSLVLASNDPRRPVQKVILQGNTFHQADANTIYAIADHSSKTFLARLNQADSGKASLIGSTGISFIRGLAQHDASGYLFGAIPKIQSSTFIKLDAQTGLARKILEIPDSDIRAITFDGDTLWCAGFGGKLFRMELQTGETKLVGHTGISNLSGLAINPMTKKLWAASGANKRLYILDRKSAQRTWERACNFALHWITFDAGGELFGLFSPGFYSNTNLALLDTAQITTGADRIIGDTGYQRVFALAVRGDIAVGVHELASTATPSHYALSQNYPNPFNPTTTIEFALPTPSFVSLKIYNTLGEEVATLVAEKLPAGNHQRVWEAHGLASGVYLYRLQANSFTQTRKLILLR